MALKAHVQSGSSAKAPPAKSLMSGNEAVAWAALDSGICYASAYPGTPTTDIQEFLHRYANPSSTRVTWSINEKVSYESALAVAISGRRALVSMKQVGLNVASDAFLNSMPGGCNGGLVLVVGDDAECHSSQNKQDTRHYRPLAGTILLEPADAQEVYDMTRASFGLSERYRLPIMVRLSTRTAFGSTPVLRRRSEDCLGKSEWPKDPERFFIVPSNSRKLFHRLAALQDDLSLWIRESRFTIHLPSEKPHGHRLGILCTGIGYLFAEEYAPEGYGLLKVAGEPFPEAALRTFVRSHDRIVVLEEGDPILEARAKAAATECVSIEGRLSGHLKIVGELQPQQVSALLRQVPIRSNLPVDLELPLRLPEICKPCGYHKVFGALKRIPNLATPSDIGCNALGGLPPYRVMDGIWAMGSSIGVACGLAAIQVPRVLAIIGDSTFYHAGIPPLIEAVHEGYQMTVLVLDNGTTAMTGGQPVSHRVKPGTAQRSVDLPRIIHALGVSSCTTFDPHALGEEGIRDLVEQSFTQPGVKVLLYRSQCGLYNPGYFTTALPENSE